MHGGIGLYHSDEIIIDANSISRFIFMFANFSVLRNHPAKLA